MPSGSKRRKLDEKPSFLFTAPTHSSPTHFLNLPIEVRQNILSELLQIESADFPEPHWQLALPFERPVVYVHDQEWIQWARSQVGARPTRQCTPKQHCDRHGCKTCGCLRPDTYWGTAKMARLFTINRKVREDLMDLLYSQFAFYIVPWGMGEVNNLAWRTWLLNNNPTAINRICHFHLCIKLSAAQTSIDIIKMRPEVSDLLTQLRIDECRELSDAFPSLKSVALQILYEEPLSPNSEPETHAEQIMLLANFFKERNIRVIVFSGPCMGKKGREMVSVAQERLNQKRKLPILVEQTVQCAKTKSDEIGCGEEQCHGKLYLHSYASTRIRTSRCDPRTYKKCMKWNMILRKWESNGMDTVSY
jgi:hypothetical protein